MKPSEHHRYLISVSAGQYIVSDMQASMTTIGWHDTIEQAIKQITDLHQPEPQSDPAQSLQTEGRTPLVRPSNQTNTRTS